MVNTISVLENQIEALQGAVGSLPDSGDLDSGLLALDVKLKEVKEQLAAIGGEQATANEVEELVNGLTSDIELVKNDLQDLVNSNNVLTGDLIIFDASSLAAARSLGYRVSIVTGNVRITVGDLPISELEKVTTKLQVVMKDVEVVTAKAFDLSGLASVAGNYMLYGHDIDDSGLVSVGGFMEISYEGDYDYPALEVVVAGIRLGIEEGENPTVTKDENATKTGDMVVNFPIVSSNGVTVFYGVGMKPEVNSNYSTKLIFDNAVSVVFGNVPVNWLDVPKAVNVLLGYDKELEGRVLVYAPLADQVKVMSSKVTGELLILTADFDENELNGTWNYFALEQLFKNTDLVQLPENWNSFIDLPNLEEVDEDILFASSTLGLPKLQSTKEGTDLFLTQQEVNFPGLVIGGALQLYTPTSLTLASVDWDTLDFVDDTKFASMYLTAQLLDISPDDLSQDYTLDALKIIEINGSIELEETLQVEIRPAGPRDMFPLLENVILGGRLTNAWVGPFDGAYNNDGRRLPSLKSVSVSGNIDELIVRNLDLLEVLSLKHEHIVGRDGASLTVTNNAALETLETENLDFVRKLRVRDNDKLAQLDFSSMKSLVLDFTNSGDKQLSLVVRDNNLSGTQTPSTSVTGTTDGTQFEIASADFYSLKGLMDELAVYAEENDTEFQDLVQELTVNLWIDKTDDTSTEQEEEAVLKIQGFRNHPYLYTWSETPNIITREFKNNLP